MAVPMWRRALAAWLTICMVTSLVPVSPGMAEEFLGQESLDVIAEDNIGTPEASANLDPNGVTIKAEGDDATVRDDNDATQGDNTATQGETPTATVGETSPDADDADGITVQSGDLAYGEVQGTPVGDDPLRDYSDGWFTDGVAGQTEEGATPRVYFKVVEDESTGARSASLVYFDDGITTIAIPTAIRFNDESLKVKKIDAGYYPSVAKDTLTTVSFYDNSELVDLGTGTFCDCTKLANVTLPDSLERLGESMFRNTAITSITIPARVSTLDWHVFENCKQLESVAYAKGSQLTSISFYCFGSCEKLGIDAVNKLPTSVTSIEEGAFYGCDGFEGVLVIPDTVQNIGQGAFSQCHGITSVKLPAGQGDWSQSIFSYCESLTSVVWPTEATFTTIPELMFNYCALSDPAIITSIPASVTTIGNSAFCGCEFEEVDIPDTVDVIGRSAFDCASLKHLEWPQDNGNFTAYRGGFSLANEEVANAIIASLPPSVKTIGDADTWNSVGSPSLSVIDLSATKVETIEARAFYYHDNIQTVILPDTLTSIGEEAFAQYWPGRTGDVDITIPASVTHIGVHAFDSNWGNRNTHRWTLHIMNPDLTFEKGDRWGGVQIDGETYEVPFFKGTTIYASATDSRGRESFIHKWSQTQTTYRDADGNEQTCKLEDLGKYVKSSDDNRAYDFVWVEITAPTTVSGTVPKGAALTMTQGTGAARKVTNVKVAADGSFSTQASAGMGTVLRVSLPGYYDYTLTRSASAMKGSWSGIEVTTAQMEKIPTKSYLTLSLKRLVATGEDGTPSYANIASEDNFTYALVDAQGHDVAFTAKGTILTITANNDDNPANDIAEDAKLTLTATPKASAAKAYQVGAATTTATLADGAFDAVLPAWGTAAITANLASVDSHSSVRVMVFKGNRCVDTGSCMSGQTYTTVKLEAGTYTVVGIDGTAGFTTNSLTGLTALGLDGFVTRQDISIADGKKTEVAFDVAALDTAQIMANAGLTRAAFSLKSKYLVFGGEQTATIDYQLDTAKITGAEFRLVLPTGTSISSCGSSESGGRVGCDKVATADGEDTYAISLANASSGKLYVKFVATTAGSCTVGLSAIAGGVTVPVSSGSYTCNPLSIQLNQDVLSAPKGSVTIYAAPLEDVTVAVTSSIGTPFSTQIVRTGASCSRTVNYTLPAKALAGESYTLRASIGTKGSDNYHVVAQRVTYIPGTAVADFTITNGDNAFQMVRDYDTQPGGVTILYHVRDKKYARWGFSMTLDASSGQTVGDSFTLDVETLGGTFVRIPMHKTRAVTGEGGAVLTTYTGTYLDEVWLDAYEWAVENNESQVWNFDWNKVFVPQSISFPNSLLTSIVTIDPEILEEVAQREYEERVAAQEQMLQQYIAEYRESLEEGGDVHRTLEAYDDAMQTIVDVLNDAIRKAAADAGETVDEKDLIPTHTDTIDYFSEAGADGVTVEDLLFDDEWADPYHDPTSDEDWYSKLYGSNEFEDENGNSIELNDDEKQALSEAKAEFDKVVSKADEAENRFTSGLGVKNDLSSYSSLVGVEADALKGSGAAITDLTQEGGTSKQIPTNEMGTSGKFVEKKGGYAGFVASDGTKAHVDVTFTDKSEGLLNDFLDFMTGTGGDILGVGATLFDEFKGLYLSKASTLGPLLHSSPAVRRLVTTSLRWMDRTMVRGVSVTKAISVGGNVAGAAFGTYGAYNTAKEYVDAKALWESTKYDIEMLDKLIEFWLAKDPATCQEKEQCIVALNDEKAACKELCSLLKSRSDHLCTDATVSTVGTVIGVAGSVWSLGTSGVAVTAVGTSYNAGSTIVHDSRDLAIKEAWGNYKYKTDVRKRVCRCSCPESNPDCRPTPPPGGGEPEGGEPGGGEPGGGTTIYRPENYLDPSGVVYEAVLSNPVEGARVTVWRSDSADGSGKVADETFVATGQANPQVTGADGVFQWDVTTGYYQVVVDGGDAYEGVSSAWLPVTPPQLGVNLGVVSKQAPKVESVAAYTDYVEVIFSQWMRTGDVRVTGIDGATCEWADAEQSGDPDDGDVVFSKVLRIRKSGGFAAGSTVSFGIAADGVTSYNGKHFAAAYSSGKLTVAQRPARILLNVEGDEQGSATTLTEQVEATDDIDAYVVDAAGKPLANQRVSVACGSGEMATIASMAGDGSTTVVTDKDGKASFALVAHLPGMTDLTFRVDGTSLSRTIDLVVEGVQVRPNRPRATITDGKTVITFDADSSKSSTVTVTAGATLALVADEGDVIYYTTNDTCPCKDSGRVQYAGPITLKENTYFRIAAYNGSYDPSAGGYSAYSRRLNLTINVKAAPKPQVAAKDKTYKVGNFYYKVTNAKTNGSGTVTLAKPAKTTYVSVSVPNTVKIYGKSYKVTAIAAKAFAKNKKLKKLKIGVNVTSVGASAFQSCAALGSVTIGPKVKTIGASAFQGCAALTKLAVGKAVTTIGAKAFYGCKKLASVSGGAALVTIGKQAFASCAKLKSFSVSSKALKTLGAQAFSGDKLLVAINIDKTAKLKTVTNSLKGSKVATVNVLNSKAKAYQKLFKKAGKTVKVA
ncbi:MAG: leucine-rich repeat protein [Atopobiaceae bacterium]|nr:leucine-rich repeat protein [Atopobiaceae bacterium]